jgi:predicted chitinase
MPNERELQLLRAAMAEGITSREELSNFMAQVGHESNGLLRLEEGFRYTRGIDQIPVRSARREGLQVLEAARLDALQGRPQRLAELMYGERMGNTEPADGYTYRGRGYIQLTGKDNYRAAGEALGLDLVGNPGLAAEPGHASRIAVWFWNTNVPEAAREDVLAATRAINGGENGLADRQHRYDDWYATLTPDYLQQLGVGVEARTSVDCNDVRHPAYPRFAAILEQLQNAEAQRGIPNGPHSANLAGALTVQAIRDNIERIDRVELNADYSLARVVQVSSIRDEPGLNRVSEPVSTHSGSRQTLSDSSERIRVAQESAEQQESITCSRTQSVPRM